MFLRRGSWGGTGPSLYMIGFFLLFRTTKRREEAPLGVVDIFLLYVFFSLLPSFILSFVFDLDLILVMLFEMFCRVTILISSTLERVIGYPIVFQGSSIGRGP